MADLLSVRESVGDQFPIKIPEDILCLSGIFFFLFYGYGSIEQRSKTVTLIGEAGYTSVADHINMENYEAVEEFYSAYLENRDAMVTISDVNPDGIIGAVTFLYREGIFHLCTMKC